MLQARDRFEALCTCEKSNRFRPGAPFPLRRTISLPEMDEKAEAADHLPPLTVSPPHLAEAEHLPLDAPSASAQLPRKKGSPLRGSAADSSPFLIGDRPPLRAASAAPALLAAEASGQLHGLKAAPSSTALDWDWSLTRDLPPSVRAVVEDNKVRQQGTSGKGDMADM